MDALGNIASNPLTSRFNAQNGSADAVAARQEIDGQIQAIKAKSVPGTATNVQYSYETGPNGELIPVSATVQSTQVDKSSQTTDSANATQAPTLTSGGNLLALSPADEVDAFGLTAEERAVVRDLQTRDLEVRVHEGQHLDAAGGLASGGAEYTLQVGPDGKQYAVGGNVNVQTSATNDPEKAARDSQTFALSASAPADASAQDISVARDSLNSAASALQSANRLQTEQIIQSQASTDIQQAPQSKNDGQTRTPLDITV